MAVKKIACSKRHVAGFRALSGNYLVVHKCLHCDVDFIA